MNTDKKTVFYHRELKKIYNIFIETINSLNASDWEMKCGEKPFSVGEIMMQITSSLEFLPTVIHDIQKGKGFTPPPAIIMKIIRFFFMGFMGRDLTREEIKSRYRTAYEQALQVLDTIKSDDWQKKAKFFGHNETIEQVFLSYLQSASEDLLRIKRTIKKPAI